MLRHLVSLAFPVIGIAILLGQVDRLGAQGIEVPAQLPQVDGKAGDHSRPVQVYILAGQSNMVGMGTLSGATNRYSGVYLASDPKVPTHPLPIYQVGHFNFSRLQLFDTSGQPTDQPAANGFLEVPSSGHYQVHCGFEDTSYGRMSIEDVEVYRRENNEAAQYHDIELKSGKRYAYHIQAPTDNIPHLWLQQMNLQGHGDLEAVVKREGMFPWILNAQGEWSTRQDVYFQEARLTKEGKGSWLSATSNGKTIGPELGFGHVIGTYHDAPVLLIKTAQGNRSLGFDFRPPSSGRTDPDNEFESAEYRLMVEGVRKTLNRLDEVVPGYEGQGYELAGFLWFQGHKDSFDEQSIKDYEENLVNLIQDVRQEFKVPDLPAVIATVGFGGDRMQEKFLRILQAQQSIADARRHPDLEGTVVTVDTRPYWREVDQSPKSEDYHYNRNAETYLRIGDAMGRAMIRLRGGTAADLAQRRQSPNSNSSPDTELSDDERRMAQQAIKPVLMDGIIPWYVSQPRIADNLRRDLSGTRPERSNQFLRDSVYGLENCFRAIGIHDYDWKPFGPDLNALAWDYYSFDPSETLPIERGARYRKITLPDGMENWNSIEFDPTQHNWRKGQQPFGQLDGVRAPLNETCAADFCRCGETPKTLWEKEVLLIRGKFQLPPLQDSHRYRIVLGGSSHVNSGEGYAIYLNGKLAAESTAGVAVRQGGQPRGVMIFDDLRDEFGSGEVTIAVKSFLRYHHPRTKPFPPRGHLSVMIQQQKRPVVTLPQE